MMIPELDKARLLDLLEAEYEFVHRTIDNLSSEAMLTPDVEGTWSIKDTIAHLTAWMKFVMRCFAAIEAHQTPEIPEVGKINTINDTQTEKDKNRSLDDVLADFHNTYHDVYRLIESLNEEDLFESTFNGLITEPMWHIVVENTYEHFQEHIRPVREWLGKNP